jgi:DNA-damage-inducible protein D
MSDEIIGRGNVTPFDQIRQIAQNGEEYWRARDLASALGYADWTNFQNVLQKAHLACLQSGEDLYDHFRDVTDMITVGKGASRQVQDVYMSRYACYLVAMNGDTRKKVIAEAQTYFAIQTRRQELTDQQAEDQRRLYLRNRVRNVNGNLNRAAHESGVEDFPGFHNAGYEGLYGGYDAANIKKKKGIPANEDLLDCVSREELAAHEFRITQTEAKLRAENVQTEEDAKYVHRKVSKNVRESIANNGNPMPEDLPAVPPIRSLLKNPENKAFAKELPEVKRLPETLKRPAVSPVKQGARWKAETAVVVVGVTGGHLTEDGTGFQNFPNFEAARDVFADLDIYREGPRFTQAMGNPEKDKMRFETWKAYERYSS